MYCNRGSVTSKTSEEIKVLKKAREWFSNVQESDLPIKVIKHTAENGRFHAQIFNSEGKKIHTRG